MSDFVIINAAKAAPCTPKILGVGAPSSYKKKPLSAAIQYKGCAPMAAPSPSKIKRLRRRFVQLTKAMPPRYALHHGF